MKLLFYDTLSCFCAELTPRTPQLVAIRTDLPRCEGLVPLKAYSTVCEGEGHHQVPERLLRLVSGRLLQQLLTARQLSEVLEETVIYILHSGTQDGEFGERCRRENMNLLETTSLILMVLGHNKQSQKITNALNF